MVSGVNGVSGVSVIPPVEKEPKGPENKSAYLICLHMSKETDCIIYTIPLFKMLFRPGPRGFSPGKPLQTGLLGPLS